MRSGSKRPDIRILPTIDGKFLLTVDGKGWAIFSSLKEAFEGFATTRKILDAPLPFHENDIQT
jgi:hypothetical protein